MLNPGVIFLLLLVIGIAAGLLFDRFAGPGWLSRQVAGPNRLMLTSALVGIAGSFVGYHLAVLIGLSRRCRADRRDRRRARGAVGVANGALAYFDFAHVLFGKPVPTHSASKTRVNALMIKSGAGFFRNMRYRAGTSIGAQPRRPVAKQSSSLR